MIQAGVLTGSGLNISNDNKADYFPYFFFDWLIDCVLKLPENHTMLVGRTVRVNDRID